MTCPQVSYLQVQLASHLSKLQISSAHQLTSKATPTFCLQKSVLTVQMAHVKSYRAYSSHCMAAGDTKQPINFTAQVHVKQAIKVNSWVLHDAQETE